MVLKWHILKKENITHKRIIISFIDKLLKGGRVLMATSSIFTNVKITDRNSAEKHLYLH